MNRPVRYLQGAIMPYFGMLPLMFTSLVVLCYFFYPVWGHYRFDPIERYLASFAFLFVFSVILGLVRKWTKKKTHRPPVKRSNSGWRWSFTPLVLATLIGMTSFQFVYVGTPILSGDDEPYHVRNQLMQWHAFQGFSLSDMLLLLLVCTALVVAMLGISGSLAGRWKLRPVKTVAAFSGFTLLLSLLVFFYASLVHNLPPEWGQELRWPPLGTLLGVASFTIFGASELSARLATILFYGATLAVLYQTIRCDTGCRLTGLLAIIVCMTSPVFFAYGHLAYREVGGCFFISLGMLALVNYCKDGDESWLQYAFFAVVGGFLERRPVAIFLLVCLLFIALRLFRNWRDGDFDRFDFIRQIGLSLSLCLLAVIGVVPWVMATRHIRSYDVHLENFLDARLLFAYASEFPRMFSWPVLGLFILGVIVVLRKRPTGGLIGLTVTAVLYLFFTGDEGRWIPVERFTVLFIPAMAVVSCYSFHIMRAEGLKKKVLALAAGVSILGLIGWMIDKPMVGLASTRTRTAGLFPHYPFDDILTYMKHEKTVPQGPVLHPKYWQPASLAYYPMYNMDGFRDEMPGWKSRNKAGTTLSSFQQLFHEKQCVAAMLRLTRGIDGVVAVSALDDLTYLQVATNTIPEFNVDRIIFNGIHGLALLTPLKENETGGAKQGSGSKYK